MHAHAANADAVLEAIQPTFAPLVPACARFGIGRTIAFKLAREGTIDTFRIGARTFVSLPSLESLPRRLADIAPRDTSAATRARARQRRPAQPRRR